MVLIGQLAVDAPTGEVDFEEEAISPERFRENRASLVAAGRTIYETVALAPDGTVAAQSTISVPPPGRTDVSQWGTFVHRAHRGRRLGLAVKAANLRAVQRDHPEMRRVVTQNAETNDWMVAINEQMGFEPVEASAEFVRRRLRPRCSPGAAQGVARAKRTASPGRHWAHWARSAARTTATTG